MAMSTYAQLTPRGSSQRETQVMRAISECRGFAAQRLAAEERRQEAIAYAEWRQLLHEAGMPSAGIGSTLVAVRTSVGSALIWLGEHLRGRSAVDAATNAAASAG
jgi:hypothetical protein